MRNANNLIKWALRCLDISKNFEAGAFCHKIISGAREKGDYVLELKTRLKFVEINQRNVSEIQG